MQKSAPSVGRLLIMAGFALSCFGLFLFLWLAFGGPVPLKPKGYRVTVPFREAAQLAEEADVRISGVSVGKVKTITADADSGTSDAEIEIDSKYAPIPKDTKAILRQKTLLGETYVELSPGTKGQDNAVPDGGSLPAAAVSPTVELDEIFRAFDPQTRQAFRVWMQEQAIATKGRGRDISDTIGTLRPFAEDTLVLLQILNGQQPTLRRLVSDSGTVFSALSARDGQLRSLVENANRVFATTAARDDELRAIFRALPTFNREARSTVDRLTAFSNNADPLVTQLRPAARELSPTLRDLSALAPDLEALFRDLDPAIAASRTGLPALQRFTDELRPVLGALDPPLRQLAPPLDGLAQYKSELTAFLANVPASTQGVTVDSQGRRVHYLRTTNPIGPENFAAYPRRLPTNRPNPYPFPRFYDSLPNGLPAYETRQCTGRAQPQVAFTPAQAGLLGVTTPITGQILPSLQQGILQFAFNGAPGNVLAPPCVQQPPFPVYGTVTQFPHVRANRRLLTGQPFSPRPSGTATAAAARVAAARP
jgi:phospholipid/cholesterol/gamma-HCH transport system substrate-binding protein